MISSTKSETASSAADPSSHPASGISAVMITLNELENLKRSIPSLSFCDEIILVDSGSTDGSLEYARSMGCQVHHRAFDHFGAQKAFATTLAKHDWVFSLDADECVTPGLAQEIRELIRDPGLSGIWIRSRLVFLGREFKFGRESRVRVLRIFRKSRGAFDRASVHEKVVLQDPGASHLTRNHILHHSYPDLEHYLTKMNRYTTLGAERLRASCGRLRAAFFAALFPFKFLQFYFQHLNFLNGWEGFCWSLLSTGAYFIKFVKVWINPRTRV
jgi:glycosyltransferase involved in cell wall biosynthesis